MRPDSEGWFEQLDHTKKAAWSDLRENPNWRSISPLGPVLFDVRRPDGTVHERCVDPARLQDVRRAAAVA